MFIGAGTSAKLTITTSAAADIEVTGSKVLIDQSSPPVVDGSNTAPFLPANFTSAAGPTDVVVGVASRITRIDEMQVHNNHATLACDVTFIRTDGTNPSTVFKCTLLPNEHLSYGGGQWTHYDANGGIYSAATKLSICLLVASDVTNATTSFADVTGLTYAIKSGKRYSFEAHLTHQTNATTTGSRFGVNGPASPTVLMVNKISGETPGIAASNIAIGCATAYDPDGAASTTGPGATNTVAIVSGYIQPSADGTFAIRCQSEVAVAGGLVIKAGSWMWLREVD
jgi:hypothetical protein